MSTTFDIFYANMVTKFSEFIDKNKDSSDKSTVDNVGKAGIFRDFELKDALLKSRDLFTLRDAIASFKQSLIMPDPTKENKVSKKSKGKANNELPKEEPKKEADPSREFEYELHQALKEQSVFECYYSVIEERLRKYIDTNEGSWTKEASALLKELEEHKDKKNLLELKKALSESSEKKLITSVYMIGTVQRSDRLLTSMRSLLGEIPSERYENADSAAQRAGKQDEVFRQYYKLLTKVMVQGQGQEDAWKEGKKLVQKVVGEKAKASLWELKKAIHDACEQHLKAAPIGAEIEAILAEIPSERYAEAKKPVPEHPRNQGYKPHVPSLPSSSAETSTTKEITEATLPSREELMAKVEALTKRLEAVRCDDDDTEIDGAAEVVAYPTITVAANQAMAAPAPQETQSTVDLTSSSEARKRNALSQ